MNNLDQSLINGLYKEMVKELNRLFTSSNYHVKRTAADNAREAQRCLNNTLRRCGEGYQVQIPEEYFNENYTANAVYISIKNISADQKDDTTEIDNNSTVEQKLNRMMELIYERHSAEWVDGVPPRMDRTIIKFK